jgi:hypothetical protein
MPLAERSSLELAQVRWRRRALKMAGLSGQDWRVLVEAFGLLLVVGAGLRGRSFARMAAWATRVEPAPVASIEAVERIAWLVGVAARATRFKCLVRSLALSRVLARRGITTSVQIGVRPGDRELLAHAWVEWNGRVLNDSVAHVREYVPLDRPVGAVFHG